MGSTLSHIVSIDKYWHACIHNTRSRFKKTKLAHTDIALTKFKVQFHSTFAHTGSETTDGHLLTLDINNLLLFLQFVPVE